MEFTVLIWIAIAILWSVKAASEQRKRNGRQTVGTDERVAPPVETQPEQSDVRPNRRAAGQKAQRSVRREKAAAVATSHATVAASPFVAEDAAESGTEMPSAASQHPAATESPLGEPFDLQRAVIYSEILKPKFEA